MIRVGSCLEGCGKCCVRGMFDEPKDQWHCRYLDLRDMTCMIYHDRPGDCRRFPANQGVIDQVPGCGYKFVEVSISANHARAG